MLHHVLYMLQARLSGSSSPQDVLNVDACCSTSGSANPELSDGPTMDVHAAMHVVYIDGRVIVDDMSAMQEISRQLSTDASQSMLHAMTLLGQGPEMSSGISTGQELDSVQAAAEVVEMLSGKALGPAANVALRGTHVTSAGSGGHVTYEKHMAFVADALRSARARGSTVLLVLDEFDVFARQSKQTLLYHLLDLTQSQDARFGLVGLTSRLDVVDLLEKRLRSRFSHNQILLTHPSWDTCKQVFRDALALEGGGTARGKGRSPATPIPAQPERMHAWNAAVDSITTSDPAGSFAPLLEALEFRWAAGYSLGSLLRCLEVVTMHAFAAATANASTEQGFTSEMVCTALQLVDGDFRAALLIGLSQVELCLVIALCHMERRGETAYNFDAAWRQYRRFLKGDLSHSLAIPHAVALKSFHHLVELDLVRFAPGTAAARAGAGGHTGTGASAGADLTVAQQHNACRLQIDAGAALTAVTSGDVSAPAGVRQWAAGGSAETGGE